jgi:ParB family transcriptional regulator, chromosome partitioning protein
VSKKSSLGRGLDALLGNKIVFTSETVQRLTLAQIRPSNLQPRHHFDQNALDELALSIREKGILQPLLVRPVADHFELVAGERRYRAAGMAGLTEVPVLVKDLTDREALEIAIIENLQREDLNPVEEAMAYAKLIENGMTQEAVGQAVGKNRSTVANSMRLLNLPKEALDKLVTGELSSGHARAILAMPEADRVWGLEQILTLELNVRQAETLSRQRKPPPLEPKAPKTPKESNFHPLELDLSRSFGTRVRILGSQEKGKVELSFASPEELQTLLERLGYEA